ncbi:MAG: hypothetical protein NUW37_04825 [Planctomycetes bacterium]|nr:hypothetical protein [Planctomycetota bacterium]
MKFELVDTIRDKKQSVVLRDKDLTVGQFLKQYAKKHLSSYSPTTLILEISGNELLEETRFKSLCEYQNLDNNDEMVCEVYLKIAVSRDFDSTYTKPNERSIQSPIQSIVPPLQSMLWENINPDDYSHWLQKYLPEPVRDSKAATWVLRNLTNQSNWLRSGRDVFIAMPMGSEGGWEETHLRIQKICNFLGLVCRRVDDSHKKFGLLWDEIVTHIEEAEYVIIDFRGDKYRDIPNPNVMTEAGIARYIWSKKNLHSQFRRNASERSGVPLQREFPFFLLKPPGLKLPSDWDGQFWIEWDLDSPEGWQGLDRVLLESFVPAVAETLRLTMNEYFESTIFRWFHLDVVHRHLRHCEYHPQGKDWPTLINAWLTNPRQMSIEELFEEAGKRFFDEQNLKIKKVIEGKQVRTRLESMLKNSPFALDKTYIPSTTPFYSNDQVGVSAFL